MASPHRRRLTTAVLTALGIGASIGTVCTGAGCAAAGSAAAITLPPQPPPPAHAGVTATTAKTPEPDAADGMLVYEYVKVTRGWIEPHLVVDASAAQAWGADPANAKAMLPATRHILVKVATTASAAEQAAARKKADAVLARVKRGEDFAKVARETTDDPGSKDQGGRYPGDMVQNFIEEYRTAYAALAPGEITKQLVKTQFGWHVIKKERVDAEAVDAGYKKAKALEATRRLADRIAARVKAAPPSGALARITNEVVTEDLGPKAAGESNAPDVLQLTSRPQPPVADASVSTDCALVLSMAKGAVLVGDLTDKDGYFVATSRAETVTEREARMATAADPDADPDEAGVCKTLGQMSPAQVRRLIEKLQQKKEKLERDSGGP